MNKIIYEPDVQQTVKDMAVALSGCAVCPIGLSSCTESLCLELYGGIVGGPVYENLTVCSLGKNGVRECQVVQMTQSGGVY